jgi:phosphoenolpyruvate-protein phosphotransferase (PTS system enzyme I)
MEGIGASPGIAIGKALLMERTERVARGQLLDGPDAVRREELLYYTAVARSISEIRNLGTSVDSEGRDILEVQVELLSDPEMQMDVLRRIKEGRQHAYDAVLEAIRDMSALFEGMQDAYIAERSTDVQDMGERLLRNLEENGPPTAVAGPDTILIAWDLAPSDTLSLDTSRVHGFVTGTGGRTSHAAIIARSRGIPAVVGCGPALRGIASGATVILDGETGRVILNPGADELKAYTLKKQAYQEKAKLLQALRGKPSMTADGRVIPLMANIATPSDLSLVHAYGGEGVGLLRTEFLFMGRDTFPTEEEQFAFYKAMALQSRGKPLSIRTLDLGGDKPLPYLPLPAEENPALGYRAIRVCLDRKDIFLPQLKAILRAGVWGKVKVLFPMITSVQEVREAKAVLEEAKDELTRAGIGFSPDIPVGIMIEVPGAALIADLLAAEVDFFSIGTNDLIQYTLAADRMNEQVAAHYDPYHPAVLRLIHQVIVQAHAHHVRVSLCGEMASDPLATLLLVGMGLDEFSVNPGSIPSVKNVIVHHSLAAAEAVCRQVLEMDQSSHIRSYLQAITP